MAGAVGSLLVMLRAHPVSVLPLPGAQCLLRITKQREQKRQRDSCAGRVVVIPPCIGVTEEHRMLGLLLFLAVLDPLSWAGNNFGTHRHD